MSAVDAPDELAPADDLLGEGSLSRELLILYVTGGPSAVVAYVSLALSDAIFGEDSIPSQILGEYFDGGPQAVALDDCGVRLVLQYRMGPLQRLEPIFEDLHAVPRVPQAQLVLVPIP